MALGSLIVSAVAALGGMPRPKRVAGIVGAALSVALTFLTRSAHAVSGGRYPTVLGGSALGAHSGRRARLLVSYRWNTIIAASVSWLGWPSIGIASLDRRSDWLGREWLS